MYFRCYLFDTKANMIVDPDFINVKDMETSKYSGVTMGKKEGEIMRELIFKHRFFVRKDSVEFQGTCNIAGGQKVSCGNAIASEPLRSYPCYQLPSVQSSSPLIAKSNPAHH